MHVYFCSIFTIIHVCFFQGKNTGFDQYWLEERGQVQTYGPIMLTMQSKRSTDCHIERVFNLMHKETKQMRTLFLLQFTQWPEL